MHHIWLEKHAPRLENILTRNRSEIKNDNPLNGRHFAGCVSGSCSQRECAKNRLCLIDDSYIVYCQAKPITKKLMSCSCLSGWFNNVQPCLRLRLHRVTFYFSLSFSSVPAHWDLMVVLSSIQVTFIWKFVH